MSQKHLPPPLEQRAFSAIEKAAIFLMSLDEKKASEVLMHLSPDEIQKIGSVMSNLESVNQPCLKGVLTDFIQAVGLSTSIGVNKENYIKKILKGALGEDKASEMINEIFIGADSKGLDMLKKMDPRSVADIVRNEHPQIQTIILSCLDPDQVAQILFFFEERARIDLLLRISKQEKIHPEALEELNQVLANNFQGKTGGARSLGGVKQAADIMNFLDSSVEMNVMQGIKEKDESLAQKIEDLMFIFDNLIDLTDKDMQILLRNVPQDKLLFALKGADESLKKKIFSNMSQRAAEVLKDDIEAKGPLKISEVEAAQKEVVALARKLSEGGEITLGMKGAEEMI